MGAEGEPCVPEWASVQAEGGPSQRESGGTGWMEGSPYHHWPWGHHAGWLYSPRLVGNVMGIGGLTIFHCLNQMFQCTRCGVSQSRAEEVVQHFLREHLKLSEVVQPVPIQGLHLASDGGPQERQAPGPSGCEPGPNLLWNPETHQGEEIFKLLPVLHRLEAENKEEKRV